MTFIKVDVDDNIVYCGTTTGDVVACSMKTCLLLGHGPTMRRTKNGTEGLFEMGLTSMKLLENGDILVGAGDGTVAVVKGFEHKFKQTRYV